MSGNFCVTDALRLARSLPRGWCIHSRKFLIDAIVRQELDRSKEIIFKI